MTQVEFAKRLGVTLGRLNGIIRGRRAISAETAIYLSNALQETQPEYWMRLQAEYDIWKARERMGQQ